MPCRTLVSLHLTGGSRDSRMEDQEPRIVKRGWGGHTGAVHLVPSDVTTSSGVGRSLSV